MSKEVNFNKAITPLNPRRRQGIVEKIGRLGEPSQRSIDDARKFGKRRITTATLLLIGAAGAAGLLRMNEASKARSAEYERKIEVCASSLAGHTVELRRDLEDGHLRMRPIDYTEVMACERAYGDIPLAREFEREIQPIQSEIDAERKTRASSD